MKFKIVRGSTFSRCVALRYADGRKVEKSDIDTLYITLREFPEEASPIKFQKKLEDMRIEEGYCHFVFEPKDTEKLEYGTYYFDIALTLTNGTRKIVAHELEITQKTTFYNESGDVIGRD